MSSSDTGGCPNAASVVVIYPGTAKRSDMPESDRARWLTDLIGVRSPREADPKPIPSPGTLETRAIETIDNDRLMWFLGVLPPA